MADKMRRENKRKRQKQFCITQHHSGMSRMPLLKQRMMEVVVTTGLLEL